MSEEVVLKILEEIKVEQQISPFLPDTPIKNYILEGIHFLNEEVCKEEIDYEKDLGARSLLKNYVMYANHKRLAEFKEVYQHEYISLQIKYFKSSKLP